MSPDHLLLPRSALSSYQAYLRWSGGSAITEARAMGPDAVVEELRRSGLGDERSEQVGAVTHRGDEDLMGSAGHAATVHTNEHDHEMPDLAVPDGELV